MIIVVGIDGLEYDLVEEYDLKYLKQESYTKTSLEDFPIVLTPFIWNSMLTGKVVEDFPWSYLRYRAFLQSSNPILKLVRNLIPIRARRLLGRIPERVLEGPPSDVDKVFMDRTGGTILDSVNSWDNGVPGVNRGHSDARLKKGLESRKGEREAIPSESRQGFHTLTTAFTS